MRTPRIIASKVCQKTIYDNCNVRQHSDFVAGLQDLLLDYVEKLIIRSEHVMVKLFGLT
jgi:hypothetical protein